MQKKSQKTKVVCMRVTDDELLGIHKLMDSTGMKASDLMREAFDLLTNQWETARSAKIAEPRRLSQVA